jgi:hypothetical protein
MTEHDLYFYTSENIVIGRNLFNVLNNLINDDLEFEVMLSEGDDDCINSFLDLDNESLSCDTFSTTDELRKKGYRFNFILMEDKVNLYYRSIRLCEHETTSQKYKMSLAMFYRSVTNLAFGVFSVNPPKYFVNYTIDPYDEACAYALYLTDRVRLHSIDWDHRSRNAWTSYIRLNTKYVYSTLPNSRLRELSFDSLIEELDRKLATGTTNPETPLANPVIYLDGSKLARGEFFENLFDLLSTYYSQENLKRYLPIVTSAMIHGFRVSDDILQFKNCFLVLSRRLLHHYSDSVVLERLSLDKSIDKSTIILILLSYLTNNSSNSLIPYKLTTSLDFHNLIRLASVAGGETITVPTLDDIESMVASCIALSSVIFEGTSVKESRYVAKKFLNFKKDVRRLNKFIKSMEESLNAKNLNMVTELNNTKGESFVSNLLFHLRSITNHQTTILNNLESEIPNLSVENLISSLSMLGGSEKKLVGLIERICSYPKNS